MGQPVSQEDADPDAETGKSYGKNRVVNQIMQRLIDDKEWEKLSFDDVLEQTEDKGIFLNEYTFEIDLFNAGTEDEFAEAIKGLTDNKKMHERFDKFANDPKTLDPKSFLKLVMQTMGQKDVKTAMKYQHPELDIVRTALNETAPGAPQAST